MRKPFNEIFFLAVLLSLSPINAFVRSLIYPAPRHAVPVTPPSPIKSLVLNLGDGIKSISWMWLYETSSDTVPVVLFFHGNGENLETMRLSGTFAQFNDLKVHCIAIDYPGYGNSTGKPSEALIEKTAEALMLWIMDNFTNNPKYICGWSLGAAVALNAAAKFQDKIEGVIAVSPWSSLRDCADAHYPGWLVNWLVDDEYKSLEKARQISCPALVLHGKRDRVIPVDQGKKVAAELSGLQQLKIFPDAGHNDMLSDYRTWNSIREFIHKPGAGP